MMGNSHSSTQETANNILLYLYRLTMIIKISEINMYQNTSGMHKNKKRIGFRFTKYVFHLKTLNSI